MLRTALVVVLAAAVLAACGSSKTIVTVTRSLSATSGSTPAKPNTATSSTTRTSTTGSSTTQTSPPPAHNTASRPTVHLAQFRSPSGNIGCVIVGGEARCDIRQRRWSPPPRPPGCPSVVGFGQGLLVDNAGVGHFVCAGDTALDPSAQPLHYGTNTLVDGFLCASRINGMTCTDQRTGHGFFIAIQGWRSF